MSTPAFRTGTEPAAKAAERTSFARTHFLSIPEGGSVDIRMLTEHDSLITVQQHSNAPTRTAPPDYPKDAKWPQKMGAVCRNDVAFAGMYTDGCFLCQKFVTTGDKRLYKAQSRNWGLAVEREKVVEHGRHVAWRDVMIEIERDKQKVLIPKILVLNFGWGNFWNSFAGFQHMQGGTWLSVDIHITRTGKELDTKYAVNAWPAAAVDGTPWDPSKKQFDLRDPECALPYVVALGLDPKDFSGPGEAFGKALGDIVTERSTDEFYARFFDDSKPHPPMRAGAIVHDSEGGENTGPSASDLPPEQLAALAARIMPQGGAPAGFGQAAAATGFGQPG